MGEPITRADLQAGVDMILVAIESVIASISMSPTTTAPATAAPASAQSQAPTPLPASARSPAMETALATSAFAAATSSISSPTGTFTADHLAGPVGLHGICPDLCPCGVITVVPQPSAPHPVLQLEDELSSSGGEVLWQVGRPQA